MEKSYIKRTRIDSGEESEDMYNKGNKDREEDKS